jgi:hypothetical protein
VFLIEGEVSLRESEGLKVSELSSEVARGNGASEIVSLSGGNLGEKIKNPNEINTKESQCGV